MSGAGIGAWPGLPYTNAMIRRMLLALLVLCLALPATASPMQPVADAQMAHAAMDHDHGGKHKPVDHHATAHQCIGCAVPLSGDNVVPLAISFPAPLDAAHVPAVLVGMTSGPETPPPRA